MELRLLGPVEVAASGQPIEVGPPQRCAVLAALAVDAGRPVTVETLIDRVWGDRSPERARRALHAHVTRIRRVLEHAGTLDAPPAQLLRRPGGYHLDVDPDLVDLHRFRRLHEQAREPARLDAERVVLLREALALWRGEPLAGLSGQWATRTRQGWYQQHLDAVLAWARAELAVHNPAAVLGPLTDLVGEHPLLEPLVAVLMRALYVTGHSTEALDLYTVTRERLVEALGAEPGSQLRRVHQGVLRGDLDPHLDPYHPPPLPAPRTAPVVPAQLPRDVPGFTGRHEELGRLNALVGKQATTVVISAVSGTAGVGKTALAVHWAHLVRDRFPDGQLYVNLRGFDPGGSIVDHTEAVRRFLDALGVPAQRIPADLDAQVALYRSLLSDRRMLVVLDNARDTAQVRPLLPGTPGSLVVVTSRNQLTSLIATDGADPIALDLLTVDEARQLLSRRVGADRVAAEPQPVGEIIARCARLPLALALVAARAAIRPGIRLRVLAEELRDSQRRWETLTGDDPSGDVRTVFSWSYQALTPRAAGLFRQLGLHPGPDIAAPAAASLAGVAATAVRPLLAELTEACLLVEHIPGRHAFHDLLRAYAAEQAHAVDGDELCRSATHRMLDHYLHTAHPAALLVYPHRRPLPLDPPRPDATPEHLADYEQALTWFSAEDRVLLATVEHAADTGYDAHAWHLAWAFWIFLDRRGRWHDQIITQHRAAAAAHRLANLSMQAIAYHHLGDAHTRLSRYDDALTYYQRAIELSDRAGDLVGKASTYLSLASGVWERQGRYTEALEHSRLALDLCRAAGHKIGQADALNTIGWCHTLRGEHRHALIACRQALALHEEFGNRDGQCATWDSLGHAHHHLGQYPEAVVCYQNALDLARELGERRGETIVLTHLGDSQYAAGDPTAARHTWQQALAILDQLDHPDAEQVRTKLAML